MSSYSPRLTRLIDALRRLPGVGPKSAQRMAFHLLERDREAVDFLQKALGDAASGISRCPHCRMFREDEQCRYCSEPRTATGQVCVVESPADLVAIEHNTAYRGRYFVLMGHLSPLDGIGPDQLGFDRLEALLDEGEIREVILATNPTVEGEATAIYLAKLLKPLGVRVTRIAMGVPVGGDLEYADEVTMHKAMEGRREV